MNNNIIVMNPVHALLCASILFGIFFLIGFAVASTACKNSKLNNLQIIAISPVIGFAVLTVCSTYIVLNGIPLIKVAATFIAAICIFSAAATKILWNVAIAHENRRNLLYEYYIPFLFTAIAITLPFVFGGYDFTILRGNGTDAFNYITTANALMRYPLGWLQSENTDTLGMVSASLPLAKNLLQERWATSATFGLFAGAFDASPLELEHVYVLTLLLVWFSSIIYALSIIGSANNVTVWLVFAFIVGFWGQFLIDISALSQISSFPLLTVVVTFMITPVRSKTKLLKLGPYISAVICSALFLQYPEIVVIYLPVFILLVLAKTKFTNKVQGITQRDVFTIITFIIVLIAICLPQLDFLTKFAKAQISISTENLQMGWENAYFSWLRKPYLGFWGLGANIDLKYATRPVAYLSVIVGILLTLVLLYRTKIFTASNTAAAHNEKNLLIIFIYGMCSAGAVLLTGNKWAAGKILTYFSLTIPLLLSLWITKQYGNDWCYKFIKLVVVCWVNIQVLYAAGRTLQSIDNMNQVNFISNHGEYGRINVNSALTRINLGCPEGSRIAIFDPSIWSTEFRALSLEGNGFLASLPPETQTRSGFVSNSEFDKFDCALVNSSIAKSDWPLPSSNSEYIIPSTGARFVGLTKVQGGYGIEKNIDGKVNIFTGSDPVKIYLYASTLPARINLTICPGVKRTAGNEIEILITIDEIPYGAYKLQDCLPISVKITNENHSKVHLLEIQNIDRTNKMTLIGNDPRDLRLNILITGVDFD